MCLVPTNIRDVRPHPVVGVVLSYIVVDIVEAGISLYEIVVVVVVVSLVSRPYAMSEL